MKKNFSKSALMLAMVFVSLVSFADGGNMTNLPDENESFPLSEEVVVEEEYPSSGEKMSLRGSGALAAGTCYQFSNCSGLSTHVFNKSLCPSDTRSFIADFANFGCEPYWKF